MSTLPNGPRDLGLSSMITTVFRMVVEGRMQCYWCAGALFGIATGLTS
ncbi:protein of unknown function [Candidatus Methylomirabilis oxygeniifera]|uniref:Uncharacterized protein n=1 Tax=Methylomirabilis oxygeniifera TaxID=671143 RepID=D5MG75_METO1|nr:protein of unknown function [Candidatus Methylomirabilis oxyfera]